MEPPPSNPPIWIDTDSALSNAFQLLKSEPRIAVDTESNSLYVYQEEVCLIQISTPEIDFLFDPLKLRDLSCLGELFKNPRQQKIFHASEYDLICLKRDFHFTFANIFDTMIAARILGEPQVGLGSLLNLYFGLTLDKRYQRANWGIRPLSPEMLDYARLDTHYLFLLQDTLEKDLISFELDKLAQEDFLLACKVEGRNSEPVHAGCWKVAGANHITPRQAAILQELCLYRDEQAQKANLPHFKVFSNQLLLEICLENPHTLEELSTIHGCSERMIKKHGSDFLQAISRGETAEPLIRQRSIKPDDEFLNRIDNLKEWRKEKAKEFKVESDVILPRDLLESLASRNPGSKSELKAIMSETPFRYQKFGEMILETLNAKENT